MYLIYSKLIYGCILYSTELVNHLHNVRRIFELLQDIREFPCMAKATRTRLYKLEETQEHIIAGRSNVIFAYNNMS